MGQEQGCCSKTSTASEPGATAGQPQRLHVSPRTVPVKASKPATASQMADQKLHENRDLSSSGGGGVGGGGGGASSPVSPPTTSGLSVVSVGQLVMHFSGAGGGGAGSGGGVGGGASKPSRRDDEITYNVNVLNAVNPMWSHSDDDRVDDLVNRWSTLEIVYLKLCFSEHALMAVYGVISPSLQHPTPGFLPVDALASAASNVAPVSLPAGLFVLRNAQRRVASSITASSSSSSSPSSSSSSLVVYLPDPPSSTAPATADMAAEGPAAIHIAATDAPPAASLSSGRAVAAAKAVGGDSAMMETVVLHLHRHQSGKHALRTPFLCPAVGLSMTGQQRGAAPARWGWCVPLWGLHLRGLYQAFRSHTLAAPGVKGGGGCFDVRMRSLGGRAENERGQSNLLLDFRDFSRALAICARGTDDEMLTFLFLLFAEPASATAAAVDGNANGHGLTRVRSANALQGEAASADDPALALSAVGFECLVRFLVVAQAQHVSQRAPPTPSSSSSRYGQARQVPAAGNDEVSAIVRLANAILATEARAIADGQKVTPTSPTESRRSGQTAYAYVAALLAPVTPGPPKKSGRGAADIPPPAPRPEASLPLPRPLAAVQAAADRATQWPMPLGALLSLAKSSRCEVNGADDGVVIHHAASRLASPGEVALFSAEALRAALALFLEEYLGEHFDRAALEAAVDAFRGQRGQAPARSQPGVQPLAKAAVEAAQGGNDGGSGRAPSNNHQVSPEEGHVTSSTRGNKLRSTSISPSSSSSFEYMVAASAEIGGANPMRAATVPLQMLALLAGSFGRPPPPPRVLLPPSASLPRRSPLLGIVRVISSRPPTVPTPFNPACGLVNLGNTCFMSSALQCLVHTPMLKDYILSGRYRADINAANPLGTRGVLTQEFAALSEAMWQAAQEAAANGAQSSPAKKESDDSNDDDGDNDEDHDKAGDDDVPDAPGTVAERRRGPPPTKQRQRQVAPSLAPQAFKRTLQTCKSQFAGHEQQDVQEFLAELMDALHEDLNRFNKYAAAAAIPTSDRGVEAEGNGGAANFSRVSATATNALRRLLGAGSSSVQSRRTVSITVGAGGATKRPSLAMDASKSAVGPSSSNPLSPAGNGVDDAGAGAGAEVGGALGDQGRWAWKQHLQRNRSCVVDLFQGQLCSVVTCNECGNISRTFDPFTSLSLPLATHHNITVTVTLLRRMPRLPTATLAEWWLGGGGRQGGRDPAEVVAWALAQIAEAAQPVRLVVVLPRLADVADLRRAICAADLARVAPPSGPDHPAPHRPLVPELLSLLDCHGGLLRSVLDDRESVLQVLDTHRKEVAASYAADTASYASSTAPDTPGYDGPRQRDHRSESIHLASPAFPGGGNNGLAAMDGGSPGPGGVDPSGGDDDGLLQYSCVVVESPKNIPYILGLPSARLLRRDAALDGGATGAGDDDGDAPTTADANATATDDDADCPELEYRRGGHEARMFYDATEGDIVADVDAEPESWPANVEGLAVGRRVDALDHRGQWFTGSVVDRWNVSAEDLQDIVAAERMRERDPLDAAAPHGGRARRGTDDDSNGSGVAPASAPAPPPPSSASPGASLRATGWHVRVHFDNFSSKWDEWYGAADFDNGRVVRVYTRVPRKLKVVDLVVVQRVVGTAVVVSAPATPDDGDGAGVSRRRSSTRPRSTSTPSVKSRGGGVTATVAQVFGYPLVLQCESYRTCEHAFRLVAEQALRYAGREQDVRAVVTALVERMRQPKLAGATVWPGDAAGLPFDIRLMPSKSPAAVVPAMMVPDGFKWAAPQRSGRPPPGAAFERASGFAAWEGTLFPRDPTRPLCNLVHPRLVVVVDWKDGGGRVGGDARMVRSPSSYASPSSQGSGGARGGTDDASPTRYAMPPLRNHESYTKHVAAMHAAVAAAAAATAGDTVGRDQVATASGRPTIGGPSPVPKGAITLHDCLKAFTSLEELDENSWFCDHCKKLSCGSVTSSLSRLPDVLILHIKRFGMTARFREKIRSKVVFPFTDLDLAPFVTTPDAGGGGHGGSSSYDLYAVSNHLGGMSGGHYTAFVKCEMEEGADAPGGGSAWMHFDDDVVSVVPEDRVESAIVSEAAYLLFYRRKQLTASNLVNLSF